MTDRMHSIWPPEMIAYLTGQWDAGYPIADIADAISLKFNVDMSRNAIAGKVHRLGLVRRADPIERRKKPAPKLAPWRTQAAPARPQQPKPLATPATVYADRPAQSEAEQCKWLCGQVVRPQGGKLERAGNVLQHRTQPMTQPLAGDPEPVFRCWADVPRCRNARHGSLSYCTSHSQRAFTNFNPESSYDAA